MVAVRVSISLEIRFSGESESMKEEAPPMDGWMDGWRLFFTHSGYEFQIEKKSSFDATN